MHQSGLCASSRTGACHVLKPKTSSQFIVNACTLPREVNVFQQVDSPSTSVFQGSTRSHHSNLAALRSKPRRLWLQTICHGSHGFCCPGSAASPQPRGDKKNFVGGHVAMKFDGERAVAQINVPKLHLGKWSQRVKSACAGSSILSHTQICT